MRERAYEGLYKIVMHWSMGIAYCVHKHVRNHSQPKLDEENKKPNSVLHVYAVWMVHSNTCAHTYGSKRRKKENTQIRDSDAFYIETIGQSVKCSNNYFFVYGFLPLFSIKNIQKKKNILSIV